MKSFFRFFAQRHLFASLFTIMVLVIGINSILTIKRELFPTIVFDELLITTVYPGASPEDVEINVTQKIENALKPISGIKKYVSYSSEDLSLIVVSIDPDLKKSKQSEVDRKIRDTVKNIGDFPAEVIGTPDISKIDLQSIPIIELGISAPKMDYRDFRLFVDSFEKKLNEIKGIGKINKYGYKDREVRIEVNPEKLKQYEIPLHEIIYAIHNRNISEKGGSIESFTGETDIVTMAEFKQPEDVGDVIVRTSFEGPSVKLKDLATIKDDFKNEKFLSRMNGKDVITFSIFKQDKADIMRTVARIKEFIQEENKTLPEEIEIITSNDYSRYVKASYDVVKNNGLMGIILVLIILFVALGFRSAFWVALGIPVSIFGAITLLPFFGVYLDVITLSAMILILGIIVDDAIVVSEAIEKRLDKGDKPLDAAVNGLNDVFFPVLASILTTFLAFIPMFFIPGEIGKFVYVIPLVIILALSISFLESTIALPAHIIKGRDKKKKKKKKFNLFRNLETRFQSMLTFLLKFRYILIILFIAVLGSSFWYAKNKMEIITFSSKGAEEFAIHISLPIGSQLEKTSEKVKEIEALIEKLPKHEIGSYVTIIGSMDDFQSSQNVASIRVNLTPFSTRKRTADQIIDELRNQSVELEGFENIVYDVNDSGPAPAKPIEIKIISSDDETRKRLVNDVENYMKSINGVKGLSRDDVKGKDQIVVKLDYEKIARLGIQVSDVANYIRIAYDGETATKVQYGKDLVDFKVMLPEKSKNSIEFLKQITIANQNGRLIPLRNFASFEKEAGNAQFNHYNGERCVNISADSDENIISAEKVSEMVISKFNLNRDYSGSRFVIGGEKKQNDESMGKIIKIFIIAALGIYFLLVILFNSLSQPLLIMTAIPFGLASVIITFALHNEPLGFMAMLGVVGLSGVVVNDSLVLVSHLNKMLKNNHGKSVISLIAEGASNRLRAILLTTVTTASGLIPLAYGIGGSDPTNAPMALALGWGLVFATPLTLVLIPSLYAISTDFKNLLRKK